MINQKERETLNAMTKVEDEDFPSPSERAVLRGLHYWSYQTERGREKRGET